MPPNSMPSTAATPPTVAPDATVHKLLRTIRLDPSDSFVFERVAAPGEWAVPGAFEHVDQPEPASGRARQAFRSGFLGLGSFGWSTLVVVVPATRAERAEAVALLARHLHDVHGAPSMAQAMAAAEGEIAYAESLAQHREQTLIALHRTLDADGNIKEQFRTLHTATAREDARMPCSAGAFAIIEEATAADEASASGISAIGADGTGPAVDEIDLSALVAARTGTPRP